MSDLAEGSYDYTLTCQNSAGTSSRTVTLHVNAPSAVEITRLEFTGTRKNDQGEDTIRAGEAAGLRWAARHASACEVTGTGWSGTQPVTTSRIALSDDVIQAVGTHDFTLQCQGIDGGAAASQTIRLNVLPGQEIKQFTVDETASTLKPSGTVVLRWETYPTDLSCHVYTPNMEWAPTAPGQVTLLLPSYYGSFGYELRCGDKPLTQTLAVTLEDPKVIDQPLTGQYFGSHTQIMAFADQPPAEQSAWAPGGSGNMLRIDGSVRHYEVLGHNLTEAYWLWDFDKNQIQLGGSNLLALNLMYPPYRLFSPGRLRRENADDGAPTQFLPDADPPLEDQIGTIEYRGNGLYAVKFNLQIFISMAGYPLARMELLMRISQNDDGTLRITTLDKHPDDNTWFDELPERGYVPVEDGIPGVVLPAIWEVYPPGHPKAGKKMDNVGFPFRISPWFFSDRMVKVEPAVSKNGVPKTVMEVLRLDPDLTDQDGDGIFDKEEIGANWAIPKQSNQDGIYDLLKPKEFIGKPHFVGQIAMGNGERVVLYKEDWSAAAFGYEGIENMDPVAFWRPLLPHWLEGGPEHHPYFYTTWGDNPRLPLKNAQGETLHYDLGMLWVQLPKLAYPSGPHPDGKFNIYFASGVPEGLEIYDVREQWQTTKENLGRRYASIGKAIWEYVLDAEGNPDGKTVQVLHVPKHTVWDGPYAGRLVFAHTDTNRNPKFDATDPIYVQLLETAKNYNDLRPPVYDDLHPQIATFFPSVEKLALGRTVRLRWQANNADTCYLEYADQSITVPMTGSYAVTPDAVGSHTYRLRCTKHFDPYTGGYIKHTDIEIDRTTSIQVVTEAEYGTGGAENLVGVYEGQYRATMRGCPGACAAGQEVTMGYSVKNPLWVWDFNDNTVEMDGTMLTVGFNYEVQSVGNKPGPERLVAHFENHGDGTYTVHHGFQIYNPGVGNPRADTQTKFRITIDTENPDRIEIVTLDNDGDGIPGKQISGVFPMTIQPAFDGSAVRDTHSSCGDGILDSVKRRLRLNWDAENCDTSGDGIPDKQALGPDMRNPLDSDGDGIIDALEPADDKNNPKVLGGLALLDGIPGRREEGLPLAGTTAHVEVAGDWRFYADVGAQGERIPGGDTGLMALDIGFGNSGDIPEVSRGDFGLDYHHGFVQVRVRNETMGSGVGGKADFTPLTTPIATPVTLTFRYAAPLPPPGMLMVYATQRVGGRERYTKMDSGWVRLDDHTLQVTVQDNSPRDMDGDNGYVRIGIAPVANTLGGYNLMSGNAGGGGGGGSPALWMLLALLALAGVQRWLPSPVLRAPSPTRGRGE